jgi:hypothetical protein
MYEKMHAITKAQSNDIPHREPADAMVTTLPVPMVYPTTKKAGPTETITLPNRFNKDDLFLFMAGISEPVSAEFRHHC